LLRVACPLPVRLREDQRVVTAAPDKPVADAATREHKEREAIRLTLYGEGGSGAAVALDLVRAVALAVRLLKAAAPGLRWT
jgi:hypothetical protein